LDNKENTRPSSLPPQLGKNPLKKNTHYKFISKYKYFEVFFLPNISRPKSHACVTCPLDWPWCLLSRPLQIHQISIVVLYYAHTSWHTLYIVKWLTTCSSQSWHTFSLKKKYYILSWMNYRVARSLRYLCDAVVIMTFSIGSD
jgi:hypothetical protein